MCVSPHTAVGHKHVSVPHTAVGHRIKSVSVPILLWVTESNVCQSPYCCGSQNQTCVSPHTAVGHRIKNVSKSTNCCGWR